MTKNILNEKYGTSKTACGSHRWALLTQNFTSLLMESNSEMKA